MDFRTLSFTVSHVHIHTNLIQISLTVPEIMECLHFTVAALSTYQSVHTEVMDQYVWRPTFGHQISWISDLPFRNYNNFRFAPVWLENAYSPPKWGFVDRIWSLNGEQYQRDPQRHIFEWFRVEWHIDRLDILYHSGDMAFINKTSRWWSPSCWIVVYRK